MTDEGSYVWPRHIDGRWKWYRQIINTVRSFIQKLKIGFDKAFLSIYTI